MSNRFVEKMRGYKGLSPEDAVVLETATATVRTAPANHDLIREGDAPGPVFVILEGWACRYKILPEGGRQIMAFMMPGDFCDMHVAVLQEMDHSIGTLTKVRYVAIPRPEMEALIDAHPTLTRAFWWSQLVDEGVLRAWIVSMGRRDSSQRVSHLMCELYVRMRNIGLADNDKCEMPLTQLVLADALGITPVHINRVLKKLRTSKIMDLAAGLLTISDPARLAEVAGFDANYLHRRINRVAA